MKKLITRISLAILLFIACPDLIAQKTCKVLFIGNSFTYVNDLAGKFKGLAAAGGLSVITDTCVGPGAQIYTAQLQQGASCWSTSPHSYQKIHSQQWDFVVLQDNLGGWVGSSPYASIMSDNFRLRDSVKKILPCATVVWFSGWGPVGGIQAGDNTVACINRIDANYQTFNNSNISKKEVIAPFGKAWVASMAANPAINLYYSDNVHPGIPGQLLNASVLFTTIFKQDPSNFNYTGGVTAADASYLRNLGYLTVTNSTNYPLYNLTSITPAVSNNAGVITCSGTYTSYQWYKNNVAVSGATFSTYTPASNGSYCVIAANSSGCQHFQSFPINITTVGMEESTNYSSVVLYPNPVSYESVIELKDIDWQGCSIRIMNALGQIIQSAALSSDRYIIHKNDFVQGIYMYVITNKEGNRFSGKINII